MAENQSVSNAATYQGLKRHDAIQNKWIGYVPLQTVLGSEYKNLELRLTRFTMPPMQIGSQTVSFQSYQVEIPTHMINADTKELTFEYIVDEDFENYAALYNWASGIGNYVEIGGENNAINTYGVLSKSMIPVRIWLLDSYKNVRREFVFEGCWIKQFNDLALDYQNAEEIHHSFTLAYQKFTVQKKTTT